MRWGEDEREECTTAISHGLKSHRAVAPEFKPVVDWGSQRVSELWLNASIDLFDLCFMRALASLGPDVSQPTRNSTEIP